MSAAGSSKILRSRFLKAQSLYPLIKSYLPGRAGKSEKLPARVKIYLPRAGGQAVVSNAEHRGESGGLIVSKEYHVCTSGLK